MKSIKFLVRIVDKETGELFMESKNTRPIIPERFNMFFYAECRVYTEQLKKHPTALLQIIPLTDSNVEQEMFNNQIF